MLKKDSSYVDISCHVYRRVLTIDAKHQKSFPIWKSQVDFSTAGKELTPTMKMARHAILKKYANEVRILIHVDDNDEEDEKDHGDFEDACQ